LSKKTGISQTSLSKVESGATPTKKNLKKICKVLKVSPALDNVLGIDEADVPENKKEIFKLLFPSIKNLAFKIIKQQGLVTVSIKPIFLLLLYHQIISRLFQLALAKKSFEKNK
jgi:transcriptional regulator with XRE-family HTH domain